MGLKMQTCDTSGEDPPFPKLFAITTVKKLRFKMFISKILLPVKVLFFVSEVNFKHPKSRPNKLYDFSPRVFENTNSANEIEMLQLEAQNDQEVHAEEKMVVTEKIEETKAEFEKTQKK